MLSKIIDELKLILDERNEIDSENVRTTLSRLNRSIEQLENYFNGKENCSQEDANIYRECIETKMADLFDIVFENE